MQSTLTNASLTTSTSSTSATHSVYNDLRQMLIRGEFTPGVKLKVDSLKKMLNVGASPIREALSLLTSDQLVERIDQRGFRAAPASEANFNEIMMLRCQFDSVALRSSIAQGDKLWEEQLVLSHHRMEQASGMIGDSGCYSDDRETLHKQFHMALLRDCGSPILLKFCDQLYDLNSRYRFSAGQSCDYADRNVDNEHKQILSAALNRDADLASESLIQHYQYTGKFLAEQLKPALANLTESTQT